MEQPVNANTVGDATTIENQEPNSPEKPVEMQYIFKKNKAPVVMSANINLTQYKSSDVKESWKSSDYSLNSVVRHIGRVASSGHYTADAMRTDNDSGATTKDTFVSFDDHSSRRTTEANVLGKRRETPYMILYTLKE